VHGAELFRVAVGASVLDQRKLVELDWAGAGVDIMREAGGGIGKSIHEFLSEELRTGDYEVLVYDHRSGEIADFVGVRRRDGSLEIVFIHCKGSGAASPGSRVDDLYEVCGQVVRSIRWLYGSDSLKARLQGRTMAGSRVLIGTRDSMVAVLDEASRSRVRYRVVLVQPGLSKRAIDNRLADVIAAASDYLSRAGAELELWISG
jgi:hypothetical protein